MTLALMARLARIGRSSPTVRAVAERIVSAAPDKAFRREAELIHNFVRDKIRYTQDPDGVEYIRAPDATLEAGNGDCDDKAILTAALLAAVGHPSRFIAISQEPDNFSHVYVQTLVGQNWIGSDATEPEPFGWEPSDGVLQRMRQDV